MIRNKALVWAVAAVALVAAVISGYFWWQQSSKPAKLPGTVVLVFAMPGEDQAVVAQTVVTLNTADGTYSVSDPNAEVPVPGTSYTKLRDAYPFGGAELVAKALLGDRAASAGWVDVSPEAWQALLSSGFDVTLTEEFQAFDEKTDRYSEFDKGDQHVAVEDLGGFVNGLPYTGAANRMAGQEQLAAASLAALAKAKPGNGIKSSFDPTLWGELAKVLGAAHTTAR